MDATVYNAFSTLLGHLADSGSIERRPEDPGGVPHRAGLQPLLGRQHLDAPDAWRLVRCGQQHHLLHQDRWVANPGLVGPLRTSRADKAKLWEFRQIVVRLFSMLHALSLAELEDDDDRDDDRWAYRLRSLAFDHVCHCLPLFQGVIDGVGIDVDSLRALKKAECKVELVFHWIQSIVVTSPLASGLRDAVAEALIVASWQHHLRSSPEPIASWRAAW